MAAPSLELVDPNEGPARPGSPLRAALDMLIVRGCRVEYVPPAPNALERYNVFYGNPLHCRMMYVDARGANQALLLLKELSEEDPITIKPTKMFISPDQLANAMRLLNTTYGL